MNSDPSSVARDERVNRATSGCPALSALERALRERSGYRTQFQQDCVNEQKKKDAAYIADDGGRRRTDPKQSAGRSMSGEDVKKRLQALNPSLVFETSASYPDRWCVRYWDTVEGERTLVTCCGMPKGMMPEFSIIYQIEEEFFNKDTGKMEYRYKIDERNPESRGWRTVLLKCIKSGLIGQAAAEKAFGIPSQSSQLWQREFNVSR